MLRLKWFKIKDKGKNVISVLKGFLESRLVVNRNGIGEVINIVFN